MENTNTELLNGYKVLVKSLFWEKYYNCIDLDCPKTIYELGKATKPHEGFGPLAVFTSLDFAREFYANVIRDKSIHHREVIASCLYKKSEYKKLWYITHGEYCDNTMTYTVSQDFKHCPQGTDLASEVIIKELITI